MHLSKHLCGLLLFSLLPRLLHADPTTEKKISNQVDELRSLGKQNLPLYMTVFVETFWSSDDFRKKYTNSTDNVSWNSYLKRLDFLKSTSETTRSSMNTIIEQANDKGQFEATEEDELKAELKLPIKIPSNWKNGAFLNSWTLPKSLDISVENLTTGQVLNSIVKDYLSWTLLKFLKRKFLGSEGVYKRQAELLLLVGPRFRALHKLQTSLKTDLTPLKDPKLIDDRPFSLYIETISNTLQLDSRIVHSSISEDLFKAYMAPFAVSITDESPISRSDLDYNDALIKEFIKPEEKIDIPEWVAPLIPVTVSKFNDKIMYKVLASDLLSSDFLLYFKDKVKYRISFRKMYRIHALWYIAILPKWEEVQRKSGDSKIETKVKPSIVVNPDYRLVNIKNRPFYKKWKFLTGALVATAVATYLGVYGLPSRIQTGLGSLFNRLGISLPNGTTASTVPPFSLLSIILVPSVILLLLILLALFLYKNPYFRSRTPKDAQSKVQTEKKQQKSNRSIQKKTTLSSTPVSEVLKLLKASSAALSRVLTRKPSVSSPGSTTTSPLKVSSKPLKAPSAAPLKSSALTRKPSVSLPGSTTTSPLKASNKPLKAPSAAPSRALTRKPSVSSTRSTTTSPSKASTKPLKAPSAAPSRALTRKPSENSTGSTTTSPSKASSAAPSQALTQKPASLPNQKRSFVSSKSEVSFSTTFNTQM